MAGVFTHNGNIVEGLPSAANMINYDNTSSGMQATQLQAAVDELNTNKQPKTDNNLATTDKTVTGSINELKSGLTNVESKIDDATVYPYADVITIEDAVPSNLADCSVKIEPVQDLHGYDKPWVGGAGKNKLPLTLDGIKAANTSGTWSGNAYTANSVTFTAQTDNDGNAIGILVNGTAVQNTEFYVFSDTSNSCPFNGMLLNGCINGSDATYDLRVSDMTTTSTKQTTGDGEIINVTATGLWRCSIMIRSGYVASNQMFYPMIRLSTETDATFAPYTNICPITGHTEASVQRDGKNLAGDFEEDKVIDYATGNITNNSNYHTTGWIIVKQGQKITVSGKGYGGERWFYNEDKTPNSQAGINDGTYTAPVNGFFRASVRKENTTLQIEYGSTATDYVPYLGKTYTIALGDTIYGGTVDFDSGVMTVDRVIVDLGTLTWQKDSGVSHSRFVANNVGMKLDGKAIADCFQYSTYNEVYAHTKDEAISISNVYSQFAIHSTYYEADYDATQFKTAMDGHYACYELATPLTIQLTPQQIQLLKGQNTITASTGQISVTVNGVSGAIGSVQEQVNELAEDVADIATAVATKADYRKYSISTNTSSYTISDLGTIFMSLLAVTIPTGYSDAVNGLYVLCRQGNTLLLNPLYETTPPLGLTATLTDGNIVLTWTVTNNFGGSIALIDLYKN